MKSVLVVDDDIPTLDILNRLLRKKYKVYLCSSADEFYDKHSNIIYDIILMDISLKGNKDGLDLTRELRSTEAYSKVPIICLSAHARNIDRDNAMAAGVNLFLTKPVSNNIILQSVSELLLE